MKPLHLLALSAAMAVLTATGADAQQRPVGGVPRNNFTGPGNHMGGCMHGGRFHGFGGGVWVVDRALRQAQDEREPVVVREVVREAGPPPPSASADGPPPRSGEDRKPHVIG